MVERGRGEGFATDKAGDGDLAPKGRFTERKKRKKA